MGTPGTVDSVVLNGAGLLVCLAAWRRFHAHTFEPLSPAGSGFADH